MNVQVIAGTVRIALACFSIKTQPRFAVLLSAGLATQVIVQLTLRCFAIFTPRKLESRASRNVSICMTRRTKKEEIMP